MIFEYFVKLRNFLGRSWFVKLWLIPVCFALGLARATILVIPFRRFAPILGNHTGTHAWIPIIRDQQLPVARNIMRVVALAARLTPWESNCFPQAVVSALLLRSYGIPYALYLGLSSNKSEGMNAHAWVAAGPVPVSGGHSFNTFIVVGCFASKKAINRYQFPTLA